eukprot:1321772-Amorphochlora_amoeboformis.AAC.1
MEQRVNHIVDTDALGQRQTAVHKSSLRGIPYQLKPKESSKYLRARQRSCTHAECPLRHLECRLD